MDTIGNRLRQWGMPPDLIAAFEDQAIDEETLLLLDDTAIKELIPKLGQRLKFSKHLQEYRATNSKTVDFPVPPSFLPCASSPFLEDDVLDVLDDTCMSSSSVTSIEVSGSLATTVSVDDVSADDCFLFEGDVDAQCTTTSDIPDACCSQVPQKKKKKAHGFDVPAIVNKSAKGRKACSDVAKQHSLTSQNQKVIAQMCADHLVQLYGDKPCAEVKEAMAQSIVLAFPCLKDPEGTGYEQWYTKGSVKRPAYGALEYRLKYLRRRSKDEETSTDTPSNTEGVKQEEDTSSATATYDCQEMGDLTEQMKHLNDPAKIRQGMKQTARYRWDKIHKKDASEFEDLLDMFPHLLDVGMVEQDYEVIHPERSNRMFQKWVVLSACLLRYADSLIPGWKDKMDLGHVDASLSEDQRMNLAFCVLPHLYEGRKSSKGGRASASEAMELFIDFQKEGVAVDNYLKTIDESEKSQPFILAVGGAVTKPQQQFVIVERRALEARTMVAAVDLAYKVYQVFNLQYAPQTQGIWTFMDSLIYGVTVNREQGSVKAFRAYYHFKTT